jgi:hypothetical protein
VTGVQTCALPIYANTQVNEGKIKLTSVKKDETTSKFATVGTTITVL